MGFGPPKIPTILRPTMIGVRMIPQGNPHQPKSIENKALPAWARVAQDRQESCGRLFQLVRTKADQTL